MTILARTRLLVREAAEADRQAIDRLLRCELRGHRHLDWRTPLDWLGKSPFLVAEHQWRIVGTLAFPVDPPGVAWLQVFAASTSRSTAEVWEALWGQAQRKLAAQEGLLVAAIPMQEWLISLLKQSGFTLAHEVVVLMWSYDQPLEIEMELPAVLRQMQADDLAQVQRVDASAFTPLWQNSLPSLEQAFQQSAIASVAEDERGLIGYQISTASHIGAHLARLAVHPACQRRGIGQALVADLLRQCVYRGILRVTVNTQSDNLASLRLYEKLGFRLTGESFPVYIRDARG